MYKDKSIRAIGKLKKTIIAVENNGSMTYRAESGAEPTADEIERINEAIRRADHYGYNLRTISHRYFIVEKFYPMDFRKSSKNPIQKSKFFNLADMFGYSLYHFCHLFRAHFGVSIGEYILKCRLEHAAKSIQNGMSITNAAMRVGYDTPSGFAKAFRKMYGMNASEYIRTLSNTVKEVLHMDVKFEKKDAFSALGYCIKPDDSNIRVKENGAYWSKLDFGKYPKYPANLKDNGEVAAWIHPDEINGGLSYFFGFETKTDTAPDGFVKLDIPTASYAVFEVPANVSDSDFAEKIKSAWKYIFDEWFDASDKKFDESKMCFEYYLGEKAYIYIPIK